jgi:UDP-N-acetylmuramoylalanine--D-glutamate ligase
VGPDVAVLDPGSAVWTDIDVVVRAPGVSRYRPELVAAGQAGTQVTTAMALWLEDFADARVVAVTGTKGKSTTAALTASILRQLGMEVELIGNIGVPVTDTYDRPLADAYVVEVSSYQAADATVTPAVCVLTSLAPDHLDWHGSQEVYYRDKLRLVEAGPPGALAVNAASDEAVRRTAHHRDRTLFGPSGRVRAASSGMVEIDGEPLVESDRLRLPGRHNLWNLCGAVAGALLLGDGPPAADAVARAVDGFDGLPSRCRTIGRRHGLTFVDDALASNPYATVASIEAFPDGALTVILGGADRGIDSRPVAEALARRRPVPSVVVLPPDGQRLVDAIAGLPADHQPEAIVVRQADDVGEAVRVAVASTVGGGVILFSPAAPTPDGGGGFRERSRQFAEASGVGPG